MEPFFSVHGTIHLSASQVTASRRRLPKAYVRSVTALISSLRDALGARLTWRDLRVPGGVAGESAGEHRDHCILSTVCPLTLDSPCQNVLPLLFHCIQCQAAFFSNFTFSPCLSPPKNPLSALFSSHPNQTITSSLYSVLRTLSRFYMRSGVNAMSSLPSFSFSSFPLPFLPSQIITSSLDSVLRTLSRFYMRSGVNAKLPADVRDGILADLALAEAAL
ncbi:unnamed protein product [Closterium sp. Naga37s-1]|nr:unnamed protein product [Closterium sp. Naga37s-1]